MRKSKLIVLTIVAVLLVTMLASVFVACDLFQDEDEKTPSGDPITSGDIGSGDPDDGGRPVDPDDGGRPVDPGDDDDDDDEDAPPAYITQDEAVAMIVGGVNTPENAQSIETFLRIDKPDTNELITVLLQCNVISKVQNELLFGVYLQGKDEPDENRELQFGFYIINGKAYIDLGKDEYGTQRALVYLPDFDMNYVIEMLKNSGDVFAELIGLLEDLLASKNLTFDSVLELVYPILFGLPKVTYYPGTTNIQNINMQIKIVDLLNMASGLLGSMLSTLNLSALFNYLSSLLPKASFYMDVDFSEEGYVDDFDLQSKMSDGSGTNMVEVGLDLSADTPVDIQLPDIDAMDISEFSLTKLNFNIDFTLGTRQGADGKPTQLDVGKLINGFMGQNILPLDVLMLEGGTGIRLQFAIDLDLNYEKEPVDNNKISIELFLIDQYGNYQEFKDGLPAPQMGIYYTEGSFYLNLDNLLPDYMKGINLKVDASLADLIDGLITLITDAIDDVFGINYSEIKNGELSVNVEDNGQLSTNSADSVVKLLSKAGESGTSVVALTEGEDGETVYISAGVQRFIQVIGETLMLPENIIADNDSIDIILNNNFLASLNNLLASQDNPNPINFAFPDYIGDIVLSINISDIGLESVKVNASIIDEASQPTFDVELKIWDFLIGTARENLDGYINNRINLEKTSYLDALSSENGRNGVLDKILGGITMSSRFSVTFNKGTYDLAPFIAGFGVPQLAKTELLWEFTDNFTLDAQLNIQISLDRENHRNSQLAVELVTIDGIKVGNTEIIEADKVIIGIYGYQDQIFIDLSNFKIASITLPKLSFSLNFSDLVFNLLGSTLGDMLEGAGLASDLPFEFDLVELLGLNKTPGESVSGNSGESAAATAYLADGADSGESEVPNEEIQALVFGLNCDKIYATVTLAAIMSILSQTQTELGQTLSEALNLMQLELSFEMGRKNGFVFDFSGELIPMLDADGIAVYYYNEAGERLASRDADGNKLYYDEDQYARKEYNYGSGLKMSFHAGDDENPIIVGDLGDKKFNMAEKIGEFEAYQSDLVQAIINTVGKATIRANIDLKTLDNEMNLTRLINNILASSGQKLNLPINLNLDDWQSSVELVLQWDLDLKNSANSTVVLTLGYEGKQILGVYIYRNSLMLDLKGLGFFQVEIVNSNIITKLFGAIDSLVSEIEGLDLNEIINGLLADSGLPTLPGASDDENADGEVAGEEGVDEVLDDTTIDIIEYILQAVGFQDTKITINITAALFAEMLNALAGMNIGIDISLAADLDLFGGNEFNFDVGVEDIEAKINMQLAIGEEPVVDIDYDAIPDWDASNGEAFTRSLLDNLNIGFVLDIANFTGDTEDTKGDNQAMYTRVIIEKLTTSKSLTNLADPVTVPKGAFLITLAQVDSLRYENTDKGEMTPLVYIVLDYTKTSGQMTIHICSGVVSLLVDIGDIIGALSFDLDLVGLLGDTFDGLFEQIDTALDGLGGSGDGSGEEVPPTEGETQSQDAGTAAAEPSPFDAIFANLDIVELLGGGIEASLLSNGNFGLTVNFDPYLINKLIDDVLSLVFGPNTILNLAELAPDMFSDNYLSYVTWTREEAGVFWDSLSDQVVPILKDLISSLGYGWVAPLITNTLIGGVLGQVRNIVAGILPFAVFNEMTVNVEVADATVANISINGFDWGQDIYDKDGNVAYAANKSGRRGTVNNNSVIKRDGFFTSIKLYNTSESVGDPVYGGDGEILFPEGIVTWGGIPMQVTYDPYAYASNSAGASALIIESFSGKQASYQRGQNLYKATVVFKLVDERGVATDKELTQSVLENCLNNPGRYVVRGTAQFNDTISRTIDTVITVLDDGGGIQSIEPVSMHVYDELPDFITLNMNDGTSRKLHTRYVTFNNNAPTAYTAHTVTGQVAFANGTVVPVEFNYLDSTVKQINIEGAQGNVIVIDLYDYNLNNSKITDYISDTLFFKYEDGLSTGLEVTRDWTTVGAEEFFNRTLDKDGVYSTDVSGTQFMAYTYIGSGATEQRVELIFSVQTKNVAKLTINGLENTLRVDPYRYYMYLITGDEQYNPFPDVATAEYYDKYMSADGSQEIIDSYTEDVQIAWGDYSAIDFSWDNDNTTSQNIAVSLDNAFYTNSSFTWSFNTEIVIMRNEIEAIYFDEELTQSMYYIDPFEYFINKELGNATYPENAYVQFTNGKVYYMPIEWIGTEDFEVKYADQFTQLKVRIGTDNSGKLDNVIGDFVQEATVNVRVENLQPVGIDLTGSEYKGGTYYVDPVRVNYYGEEIFPETVTVVYDSGKKTTLPVSEWIWDYGTGSVPMAGQKGLTATAVITDSYRYDVNVEILDRSALVTDFKEVVVDPYTYTLDEKGNRVYSVFTDTILVYQKVGTINLDSVTVSGNVNMGTMASTSQYKYNFEYIVNYTKVENGESKDYVYTSTNWQDIADFVNNNKALITSTEVRICYNVPVTWDLSEINYAVKDVYNVKAIMGTGASQKVFRVSADVRAKTAADISSVGGSNNYYSITWGGSSLTEDQKLTNKVVRNMNVYFTDGSYGNYECTIDISKLAYTNDNEYTLLMILDGDTITYQDNSGRVLNSTEEILAAAVNAEVTVFSGDIAIKTTTKVHVVKQQINAQG